MKEKKHFDWLGFVGVVLGFSAICIALLRKEPYTWDYASTAIAAFGIITAILIAWQIFSIVDWNREKKEIKDDFDKFKKEVSEKFEIQQWSERITLFNTFSELSNIYREQKNAFQYVHTDLTALNYAFYKTLGLNEDRLLGACNTMVDALLASLPYGLKLNQYQKKQALYTFYNIKDLKKLERYMELEELIVNAEVDGDDIKLSPLQFA